MHLLWIAFILLYLWDTTQPATNSAFVMICCELLSFYCIFEIQHNSTSDKIFPKTVVNCFHFTVSLRYNTTSCIIDVASILLWIAFILLYLWDTTQHSYQGSAPILGCELLSFYCIFEIQHNVTIYRPNSSAVVNCFHFTVSLRYNTT